jgi:hypothetical protein
MALFVYAPVLIGLPILLPVLIIFLVVPGGFIVVLAGLYWAFLWLIGVVGLATSRRWRSHRGRARAARAEVVPVRRQAQPQFEPARAFAPTPVPLALGSSRGDVSAATVSIARANEVPQLVPADRVPVPDSDVRGQAA